jgi:hypothetical protein
MHPCARLKKPTQNCSRHSTCSMVSYSAANYRPACSHFNARKRRTAISRQISLGRHDGSKADEIALNPAYFGVVPIREVMLTLVCALVHCWQAHFGSPGRRRYCNREWADKLESIGVMPSKTGKPEGKRTGERIRGYVVEGGRFELACQKLLTAEFELSWADRFPARHVSAEALLAATEEEMSELDGAEIELADETPAKPSRTKYTCTTCETSVWGKADLQLGCRVCGNAYEVNEGEPA